MKTGKIIQVLGPVVDVSFEDEELPAIKDALEVKNGDKKCIMEVAQHIGNHTVRCIMLASSEGLCRDMEVTADIGKTVQRIRRSNRWWRATEGCTGMGHSS